MFKIRSATLVLILLVAASQAAVSQANNSQSGAGGEAAGKSAKLAESNALSVQVVKLHAQGKFDEALPLAEQALKLREEALGSEHALVAAALKNLAAIYLAKGKADKGRQHYTRALSIYEKNAAANGANIAKLRDSLGLLERFAFNNYPAAIEHYEHALALREKALGAEHNEVINNLYDLAELYELRNQTDKSLAIHRRVIGIKEKSEATEPDELVKALNRFTCLSSRINLKVETEEARRRVEEIEKREEERREKEQAQVKPQEKSSSAGGDTVRGGVINGKAISKPQPNYPEEARIQRVSGVVTIFVTVDERGHVVDAYPCGHPLLSEAALRAAYRARFTPTLLSGKPVKVSGIITYNFVLQ
jgi:TonB family protein